MSMPLYSRSGRPTMDRGSGNETPGSTGIDAASPGAAVPESVPDGGGALMDRAVGGSLLGCRKILAAALVACSILGVDDIQSINSDLNFIPVKNIYSSQ